MAARKTGISATPDGHNAVADRAIDILLSFTVDEPFLTANQLRERNGMSRSTIYRYLSTLKAKGLIAEESGKGFKLGPRLFEMARIARHGSSILEIAEEPLQRLADSCGELIQLTERVGRQTVILSAIESRHRIGITYLRGQTLPSVGASAKVLTAYAAPEEIDALLNTEQLQAYTPRSIVDPKLLREQLEQVRQKGYAFNDEELDEGIRAIAAPVLSRPPVRYSVSVIGPSFRLTDDKLPALIERVKAAAGEIGDRLRAYGG